jgi:hypothetical protein
MTKILKNIITAMVLGILTAGTTGCKKEGPMERTGVNRQVYLPVPSPSLFSSSAINGLPVRS